MRRLDFETIYKEYYQNVYAFVFSLCRDPQAADEMTQETFFRALKSKESFQGKCKISVWLCQIAKNLYFTQVRQGKRFCDTPFELVRASDDVTDIVQDKALSMQLHQVLHDLNEPYKEVFTLRVFGELSFAEIARLFEKTESWARVTYYRAKVKIQEKVKEDFL